MLAQNSTSQVQPPMPVSDYEEHIWMLQLQQPEQVIRHSRAWRLSGDIDEGVLRQAIKDTIEEIPDLNVRYRFSDDGDLYKYQYEQSECCLQT
ncbi:MAG: condensation domain-containing protein, partial [Psychrobacter celer]